MKRKLVVIAASLLTFAINSRAQSAAFTYQGRLNHGVAVANGLYEMSFSLFDAMTDGNVVGTPVTVSPLPVSNGLFTATLDFGAAAFMGDDRWLEIAVTVFGSDQPVVTLVPRQPITPTPYALHAGNAAGLMSIGNTPLDIKVNGHRVLRLEANPGDSPNVIGGASVNGVASGVLGATIGGGGTGSPGFEAINRVEANYGTISGGAANTIQPLSRNSVIGGGWQNIIHAGSGWSTISGGEANTIQPNARYSTISGGGHDNTNLGASAVIAGGARNTVQALGSAIGGGLANRADGNAATVGGGSLNRASGYVSTIAGGSANASDGFYGAGGGGQGNTTDNIAAAVLGGEDNRATASYATIGGGHGNLASGYASVVAGGGGVDGDDPVGNEATGDWSVIGGGLSNIASGEISTIGGGQHNIASGWTATVGGGEQNSAPRFFATIGGGTWSSLSDRNTKENFVAANSREILDKVAALPMTSWNYKAQGAGVRHLGPMAQDFHATFGLGESDRTITTVDADGVALAAIQGLNQKLTEELKRKETEITDLKQRMERLEELLHQRTNGGSK